MQNFFSNMAPGGGGEGGGPQSDVPWWMRYAGKGAGIGGGVVAVFFGFWCCISFSPLCIVAGIWQICAGLFVITLEAPFCCMFLDFVQQAVAKVDGRPVWQKALVYLVISIPAMCLCVSYTTFLGSGCIFVAAAIYGLMTVGRNLAIPPISMCFSLSTLIGSGLIFLASVVYGMQVLGPKGSKADMAAAASGGEVPPGDEERIYDNEQLPQYN